MENNIKISQKSFDKKGLDLKTNVINNPITNDLSILSYYKDPANYDRGAIFDKSYNQALELMGNDKLLKPSASINSVVIRKTTTKGLYKLIVSKPDSKPEISYINEGELINNRQYCSGTLSKINDNEYELTSFDIDNEIEIKHCTKEEIIEYMDKNKLIFQL